MNRSVRRSVNVILAALLLSSVVLAFCLTHSRGGAGARRVSMSASAFHVIDAMPVHTSPIPAGGVAFSQNGNLGNSENLTYHGGPVERTNANYLIFWEPPTLPDGVPTQISTSYVSLVERYFNDVGASGLYNNNTQYFDTTGPISDNSYLAGVYIDTSPYPASDCVDAPHPDGCLGANDIAAEVSRVLGVTGWTAGIGHLFSMYLAPGEGECFSEGGGNGNGCFDTSWCAYHGGYTNNGQDVTVAVMPYIGLSPVCAFANAIPSVNGNLEADNVINATSHEQMEAVTNPDYGAGDTAWDHGGSGGEEIGDLCAWNFGVYYRWPNEAVYNVAWGPNGQDLYMVQTEWDQAKQACVKAGP